MPLSFWIAIFIISLAVLVKSADYFVEGAERIGVHFRIEPFLIGVFVLGFGTSLPELSVSILAVLEGASEVVVGNVLGSNITNIFLVLGVAAIIVKVSNIRYNFAEFDLPLFVTSAFLIGITIWDGVFSMTEGIFFLVLFALYIIYTVSNQRKQRGLVPEEVKEIPKRAKIDWNTILKVVVSPLFIYLGARYTVESVIHFSDLLNVGRDVIAASAIALGTSLPELSVSFATLKRGKIDEMLGNVIGSNIFNILIVMSIPALIHEIVIPAGMLITALPFMLVATVVTFVVIYDKKITRWEGIILLAFYALFLGTLFKIF